MRGITVAVVAAVASISSCGIGCGHSGSSDPPVVKPRPTTFYVDGGAVRDPSGRSVIMRGVNLAGAHKAKPYLSDFQPPDDARIKNDWGMNALRFLVSWAGLEPTRGAYDQNYLAEIDKRIGWAHDAGLLVVLDMHQDLYISYGFDANMQTATIQWEPDATVDAPTEIAVPVRLFPRGVTVDCGGCLVEEEPGTVRVRTSPPGNPVVVTIRAR